MVEVTQEDRELFVDILNPDSSTAEAVRKGMSYTWEVEQIARHRQATRAALVAEIVAWLTKNSAEICDWSPPTIAAAIIDEEWSKP